MQKILHFAARNMHSKSQALPTPGMAQRQEGWRSCNVAEQKGPRGAEPWQAVRELSGSTGLNALHVGH